jgi:Skp family chaperone for outer membrane proteins
MYATLWIGITVVALTLGIAIGWMLARARAASSTTTRAEKAERALKEEAARAQSTMATAEASAKRDVAALQAEMTSRIERLSTEHRAEIEKLSRHLTEAYDELDKLRVRTTAASGQPHTDTGHGFPATMPMGDL